MNENAPPSTTSARSDASASRPTSLPLVRGGLTGFIERSIDGEQDLVLQDVFEKIALRKWLIFSCALVVTLASLAITLLTPITWQSSTKILIRYSSSESAFLKGLIPDDRVTLSGVASSEIIRSLPTLEEVVKKYDIQSSDLYEPTGRVIANRLNDLYHRLIHSADETDLQEKQIRIARQFQDSLLASSALAGGGSRASPIQVIGNSTLIPQSVKGDELITLTVKAFNRLKVSEMTNGLAEAFIDQYYKVSAEDVSRSVSFLSVLEERVASEVHRLERGGDGESSIAAALPNAEGLEQGSPLISALTTELATREAAFAKTRQIYKEGSRELDQLTAEIDNLKSLISAQERLEIAKHALARIRERRFQALNTEHLYQDRLVPISIIEPASTPPRSRSAAITRLALAVGTGLLIGSVFGLSATVVLTMIDPRVLTVTDVERTLRLPILGWIPRISRRDGAAAAIERRAGAVVLASGLSALVGRLHRQTDRRPPTVIAVASASDDEGKSFASSLLATVLTRETGGKVLLIDADAARATLSDRVRRSGGEALRDLALTGGDAPIETSEPGVDLMLQPPRDQRVVARLPQWLRQSIEGARGRYDLVVIDTPSLDQGPGGMLCCDQADVVLLVVKRQATRKGPVRQALRTLREAAVSPAGVILNFANSRN